MGVSAIGAIGDAFVQNRRELPDYRKGIEGDGAATFRGFRLSFDDRVRRAVIGNLLCHGVVVVPEIERGFGIDFSTYFADSLERLAPCAEDGLVEISPAEIRATSLGRIFLRNLAMPFDAYLPAQLEKPIFSKTL
jgi:oxygen-independent coproporphyrinogen-3 oxidase